MFLFHIFLSGTCVLIVNAGLLFQKPHKTFNPFEVIYEWKTLDFDFGDEDIRKEFIENKTFIPENNPLVGIKIWNDVIYVAVPRMKKGVPATIASLPVKSDQKSPRLKPFPGLELQKVGNCQALQSVQGFEIDTSGRLWALDIGRTNTLGAKNEQIHCPPKLMIIQIEDSSPGFSIVRSYTFPKQVSNHKSGNLNDIVLDNDPEKGWYGYISDSGDPGIIVYNFRSNRSWKIVDDRSMALGGNVNGIVLTPPSKNRILYFSQLIRPNLYNVSTKILKKEHAPNSVSSDITDLGSKGSSGGGMFMDNELNLYYGMYNYYSIGKWNAKNGTIDENRQVIGADSTNLDWIDTFGMDLNGNLFFVSNRLENFLFNKKGKHEVNYRILKGHVRNRSYLYTRNKK